MLIVQERRNYSDIINTYNLFVWLTGGKNHWNKSQNQQEKNRMKKGQKKKKRKKNRNLHTG